MASPYCETISRTAQAEYAHKKITHHEGRSGGEFAIVVLKLEPLPRRDGVRFTNAAPGEHVPQEMLDGVEAGVHKACETGVIDGGRVVDVHVTLLDGKYHEVDSNAHTFELAAQEAFWKAMRLAGPKMLLRY